MKYASPDEVCTFSQMPGNHFKALVKLIFFSGEVPPPGTHVVSFAPTALALSGLRPQIPTPESFKRSYDPDTRTRPHGNITDTTLINLNPKVDLILHPLLGNPGSSPDEMH